MDGRDSDAAFAGIRAFKVPHINIGIAEGLFSEYLIALGLVNTLLSSLFTLTI